MYKYFYFILLFKFVTLQTAPPLEEKTLEEILLGLNENSGTELLPGSNTGPAVQETTGAPEKAGEDCVDGTCVQHYLCNSNQTFNTIGAYIIDDRFGGTAKQCHYLETCCGKTEITDKPIIPISVRREGCGNRYVNGTGYTNVGHISTFSQFGELPWTVAIIKEESLLNEKISLYQAGGGLIHPRVVMTAAHNVFKFKPDQLKIRAGEWDTQTTHEIYPAQERRVSEVVIHPDFYKPANLNDIALLILESPVELADHIQPVCLPPLNANFDLNECIATGWGKDDFHAMAKYQTILKKVILPIVPKNQCVEKLRTTRLSEHFQLHDSFICAGGSAGVDTCTGDGGSPLVCPIKGQTDRYYQVGIVSWGIGCKTNIPGVYVNVPLFKSWIDQQLRSRGLDTSVYTP